MACWEGPEFILAVGCLALKVRGGGWDRYQGVSCHTLTGKYSALLPRPETHYRLGGFGAVGRVGTLSGCSVNRPLYPIFVFFGRAVGPSGLWRRRQSWARGRSSRLPLSAAR